MVGYVSAGDVYTTHRVRHGEAFVNRYRMCDAIPNVQDNACCTPRSIKSEHSLDGEEKGRDVERFKENLGSLIAVGTRI